MDSHWGPIRAIETTYRGYRFRSRQEARWAVFFDALGIHWEYEPEGFELGDRLRYLPDFWLEDQQCWAEVKPAVSEDAALKIAVAKAAELSRQTTHPVFLLCGPLDPEPVGDLEIIGFLPAPEGELRYEGYCLWTACLLCGSLGIANDASIKLPCGHDARGSTPALEGAFALARSTRFDRGGR